MKWIKCLHGFLWKVFDFCTYPCMTKGGIRRQREAFLEKGAQRGATHVIVCYDSFEMDSLARFVMPNEDADFISAQIKSKGIHSVEGILKVVA